jgi:hypothetical protein
MVIVYLKVLPHIDTNDAHDDVTSQSRSVDDTPGEGENLGIRITRTALIEYVI